MSRVSATTPAGTGATLWLLVDLDLRALARSRWSWAALVLGPAAALAIALGAAGADAGMARQDDYRSGAASLLLLGGLIAALTLGATAVRSGIRSGRLGVLLAGGAGRTEVSWALVVSRTMALAGILALWLVALQIGSVAIGEGLDGPLAVHAAATLETLLVSLLAALMAATAVGPVAAWIFGLVVNVLAQAAVNLKAAADDDALGTADVLAQAFYFLWPRAITSPMISSLQARDAAGPAAPQIDINSNIVVVPASGWGTVLWTLAWCAAMGWVVSAGLRRREVR